VLGYKKRGFGVGKCMCNFFFNLIWSNAPDGRGESIVARLSSARGSGGYINSSG